MSKKRSICRLLVAIAIAVGFETTSLENKAFSQSAGSSNSSQARKTLLLSQISAAQVQLENLKQQRVSLAKELNSLQKVQENLQQKHDEQGISGESFSDVIKSLQAKRVELMIDIAGLNARRETAVKLNNEMGKGSEELINQLNELLKIEEDRFEETQAFFKKGVASKGELQKARSRILEIKIRISEARQPANSSTILTDQLLNTALERAEKKARLEKTESLLAMFTATRKSLEEASELQRKIALTGMKMDETQGAMALEKSKIDSLEIALKHLEAKTEKEQKDN